MMTAKELSENTVNKMINLGLGPSYAWRLYERVYVPLILEHAQARKKDFDEEILERYKKKVEGKFQEEKLSQSGYREQILGMKRLKEFIKLGTFEWTGLKNISSFVLNDYYEELIREYLKTIDFSVKGVSDAKWIARKYFAWLLQENHEDLSTVSAKEIQQFIIYCSRHMRISSIHNVKLYMKKLYYFLYQRKEVDSRYEKLFNFPVSRERKLYPAALTEEVKKILNTIDCNTPRGKRDYAIILMGIVTGLRAIDISLLKLNNIDWLNGEIKLKQSKTGKSLALPLTEDVGKAVQDYILHGRQETDCDALFLRQRAPYQGFTNCNAIGDLFDDYCKKSGVKREAFDGKGFHSLRRRVGKTMAISGVPVETIAQVLGDYKLDSVKPYISLDNVHKRQHITITPFQIPSKIVL